MAFIQKQGYWISENGWRMCDTAELDYTPVPGTNFGLGVRKGAPSVILKSVIWRLNRIEPMITSQIGCYTAENSMRNSNHNSATAIDYNWNSHQYQKWGTWGGNRAAVDKVIADFRGIVEFGGNWTSPRDEMHFELHFAEGHAGTEQLAQELRDGLWGIWKPGDAPSDAPSTGGGSADGILRIGSTGPEVLKMQQGMNAVFKNYKAMPLDEDGIFGPMTAAAVTEFQQRSLIDVDGEVGPQTKAKLAEYGIVLTGQTAPTTPPVIVPQPVVIGPADDQLTMRFNCLGGQSLVEAVADIRDAVTGSDDRDKTGVVMK
ncbi:endolysin [Mycobacterium phage BigNuz]|uniref:Lysin A n=2 Tax=Bignuzvirus bignuz TaxID=1983736 RepID=G1JX41_9CAUD|nr:endolysin [Mycobacterium phage BigNuz]AEL98189.1 lysin A [Mycobacterium phage BigNuz]AOT24865.1 lysin A [Mycobacterium phage Nazo]